MDHEEGEPTIDPYASDAYSAAGYASGTFRRHPNTLEPREGQDAEPLTMRFFSRDGASDDGDPDAAPITLRSEQLDPGYRLITREILVFDASDATSFDAPHAA